MVGFAMACSLGKSEYLANKRILLLESSTKPKAPNLDSYSNRVCALNNVSKSLLSRLGGWDHIEKARYGSVRKMQVWDACSDATITFGKPDLSEEIAHVVENDLILSSITRETSKIASRLEVRYQTKITDYELPQEEEKPAQVILNDGTSLSADLIIGADGFNSGLRRAMKSQYISHDYEQMGVVATLRLSETEQNVTAWQRFLPTGPIALLPLNKQTSSLVWTVDKATAKILLELPLDEFTDRVNQALWDNSDKNPAVENISERVSQIFRVFAVNSLQGDESNVRQLPPSVIEVEGSRGAFPLGIGHAVDYVSHRAVLIGDSAHRVHPLAGQGVNLGFGDVVSLTEVICQNVADGSSDIGSLTYLRKYQSDRQKHNLPTMSAIHGLNLLYGTTWAPLVVLRSIGLNLFDSVPSIKKFMTQRAAGV